MKRIDKKGIEITHEDGIPCRTPQGFCYWDTAFANIVQQYLGRFCPDVSSFTIDADGKPTPEFSVLFTKSIDGSEALATSVSLVEKKKLRVPESEIEAFNKALTDFHKLAEQPGLPSANKAFIENFRIPDPRVMKEAWRVTQGRHPRLLVLWGYAKRNPTTDMILPQTAVSQGWMASGGCERQDVARQLRETVQPVSPKRHGWWKLLVALFLALLAGAGVLWLLSSDLSCARPPVPKSGGAEPSAYCDVHRIPYTNECPMVCGVCKTHLGFDGSPELCPKLCRKCRREHLENGKCPECDKVVVQPPPPPKVCDVHKCKLVDGKCPWKCTVDWCGKHCDVFSETRKEYVCPNVCRKHPYAHRNREGDCKYCQNEATLENGEYRVKLVSCNPPNNGRYYPVFCVERFSSSQNAKSAVLAYNWFEIRKGEGQMSNDWNTDMRKAVGERNKDYAPKEGYSENDRLIVWADVFEIDAKGVKQKVPCSSFEWPPSALDALPPDSSPPKAEGERNRPDGSGNGWSQHEPLVCGVHGCAFERIAGEWQCPRICTLCGRHLSAAGTCPEYCVKHNRHKKDGLCPQCQPVARKEKIWISPSNGKDLFLRSFTVCGVGIDLGKARQIEWRWQSRHADSDVAWFDALYSKFKTTSFGLHDIPDEMLEYCKKHTISQDDFVKKLVSSIHLVSTTVTFEENGKLQTLKASLEFKEKLTPEDRKGIQRHISLCGERIDGNGRAYGLIRVASKPFDAEAEVENWDITLDGKTQLTCYPETEINSNNKTLVRLYKDIPHDGKIRIIAKLKGIDVSVEGTINFNANMFTSAESFDSRAGNAAIARAESIIGTKSVVRVDTGTGHGTGFAVTGKDLITNAHVVGNDTEVELVIPNLASGASEKIKARVVSVDRNVDLAWLKVEGGKEFSKPLKLAGVDEAAFDDEVLAIGFPFDVVKDRQGNPDTKYVVGTIRRADRSQIVHDADIHPGNSGGPLVSVFSGRVLGVNTLKHIKDNNGEIRAVKGSQGIAVPAGTIQSAFPNLRIR